MDKNGVLDRFQLAAFFSSSFVLVLVELDASLVCCCESGVSLYYAFTVSFTYPMLFLFCTAGEIP